MVASRSDMFTPLKRETNKRKAILHWKNATFFDEQQVGLMDGLFRQNLEETGMSYSLEVDMIRAARSYGLLTTPYAFNVDEARQMAAAGVFGVVCVTRPPARTRARTHSRTRARTRRG